MIVLQMHSNIAIKMASILYLTDSAYYPAFKSMYRNVVAAMKEAQDITTHLKPLTSHFQNLEMQEFTDIRPLFPPLMHLLCLVYSHSAYYNTAARIIILLQVKHHQSPALILIIISSVQETCNLLIAMASKFLDPGSIFQIEVSCDHKISLIRQPGSRWRRPRIK